MPATWLRGSISWLVKPFPSSAYQPQLPHGEAMVLQENQMRATLLQRANHLLDGRCQQQDR